jgi:hypothetical protein
MLLREVTVYFREVRKKHIRTRYRQSVESFNVTAQAYMQFANNNSLSSPKLMRVARKDFLPLSYYAHQNKVYEMTGVYGMLAGEDKFI